MKKTFTCLAILLLFQTIGWGHLFVENFDGMNVNYTWSFSGCDGGNSSAYLGILDESMINQTFTNDTDNFLGVQNTKGTACNNSSSIAKASLGPINTFGVIGMTVCFDIAGGDSGLSDWDANAKMLFIATLDNNTPYYLQFASGGDNTELGLDAFCDGVADGYENGGTAPTYPITNTFSTYCFDLPNTTPTSEVFFDLVFVGLDEPEKDLAIDNIIIYYEFNTNGIPDPDAPLVPSTPACLLNCPLMTNVCTPVDCDATTAGTDTYTAQVDYVCGGQGAGTYTISHPFTGDDPNTTTNGSMLITENEGTDINLSITGGSCTISETIVTPTCVPSCNPTISNFTAPPIIVQNESMCQSDSATLSGGVLQVPLANCPSGSTLEYSTNGGAWSTTLPIYDQYNSMMIQSRCICNVDANDISSISTIMTNPDTCPTNIVSNIHISALLEGAYVTGTAGLMNLTLNNDGLLPTQHPYDTAPYNAPSAVYSSLPSNAVDYVLIEARTVLDNSLGVIQEIGVILDNGDVVAPDGTPLQLNLNTGESYYIWLRHRNHLDIVSAQAMPAVSNITLDFITTPANALGAQQLKVMPDGKYAMYAGDFTQDGVIQQTDNDVWKQQPAILNTYFLTDGNMDGVVQLTDFDIWSPNKAKIGTAQLLL